MHLSGSRPPPSTLPVVVWALLRLLLERSKRDEATHMK